MKALDIPCTTCGAKQNEHCNDGSAVLLTPHKERTGVAAKLPDLGELNATDKALITYYAYVIICDSVASKSEQMFGRQITSKEVQRFFGKQAVDELRKDGLLK